MTKNDDRKMMGTKNYHKNDTNKNDHKKQTKIEKRKKITEN
jgi:hypothetical protein